MTAERRTLPLLGPDPGGVRALRLVGRYALGVDWEDGHGSIYPFEALREACGCPACEAARSAGRAPAGAAWPTEVRREAPGLRIRWQDGHETVLEGRALRARCRCALCTRSP